MATIGRSSHRRILLVLEVVVYLGAQEVRSGELSCKIGERVSPLSRIQFQKVILMDAVVRCI